jgi:hypothetical protein
MSLAIGTLGIYFSLVTANFHRDKVHNNQVIANVFIVCRRLPGLQPANILNGNQIINQPVAGPFWLTRKD